MEVDPNGSPLGPKLAGSKPVRKIEHFWLCGPCSTTLTLVMNQGKVETVSIEPEVDDARRGIVAPNSTTEARRHRVISV